MSGWKYQGSRHRGSVNIEEWAAAGEHVRREANSDSKGAGTSRIWNSKLIFPDSPWVFSSHVVFESSLKNHSFDFHCTFVNI